MTKYKWGTRAISDLILWIKDFFLSSYVSYLAKQLRIACSLYTEKFFAVLFIILILHPTWKTTDKFEIPLPALWHLKLHTIKKDWIMLCFCVNKKSSSIFSSRTCPRLSLYKDI